MYVLVLDVRVSEHRTPASSMWEQSVVMESWVQFTRAASDPVQRTSSRKIGPLPRPKPARRTAVASGEQKQEDNS